MATRSLLATSISSLLVLQVLRATAGDTVASGNVSVNTSASVPANASASVPVNAFASELAASSTARGARADDLCPAVCPACPACPGCPASPACPSPPPCPRTVPPGYKYYEGLGYYKMHYEARAWTDAKAACEREGGYLVVFNSQAEADLASNFMAKYVLSGNIHVGFFDVTQKGKYITVLDEPLASTGFEEWASKEPNNVGKENCGNFVPGTGFNDITCSTSHPFLCELLA